MFIFTSLLKKNKYQEGKQTNMYIKRKRPRGGGELKLSLLFSTKIE